MPLSEHEQRLLEQIEQALYAEDPKFAQSWRVRDARSLRRLRLLRAAAALLVGLALLVAGVIVQASTTVVGVALGVAGFLLMLGAAFLAMSGRPRSAPAAIRTGPRRPRGSWKARLEERWERRQGG